MGFEPTPPKGLEAKTSALDHSATLPQHNGELNVNWLLRKNMCPVKLMINGSLLPRNTENLTAVGFEPTPPKWLVP